MTMAAVTSMLKAKLLQKGLFRPTKMVALKMPDGSGLLSELPRHTGAGGGRMDPTTGKNITGDKLDILHLSLAMGRAPELRRPMSQPDCCLCA